MIINLVDNDIKFELNWVIFELLLAEFQQTLSVEQSLITIRTQSSGYVTRISVWWLLKSEIKILMISVLLSSESGWFLHCLFKVQVVILRSKGGMKVFLLEEDIISSQQTVRKQKQMQVKSEIIHCYWLKNLTTDYI